MGTASYASFGLAMAALGFLTASIVGVIYLNHLRKTKKIDPKKNGWGPYDFNLFALPDEEKAKLRGLPTSLERALDALEKDHAYLTEGGVFPEELITGFIARKRKECAEIARIPTAAEFDRYYNS